MGRMPQEARGKTGKPTESRNKPTRPRDELGRPQAWDAESTLRLEDYDALPIEENHRLGREHLNAGRYFPAHEAWETAWKQARDTDDAEFFKGLSQLGAGYTHLLRGNAHGAVRLLRRGAGRVGGYPPGHLGVDTRRVADAAEALAAAIERGEVVPGEDARFEPPVA
jgi:predicted metal-dependent hydrolase